MAKTLEQIERACNDLSLSEIEHRIGLLDGDDRASHTKELYKQVLNRLKTKDENKPFDLLVGEYWVKLRTSAHRRNKEFNLTFTDVKRLMLKKKCAYTGKLFADLYDRSIDRLDNSKGYIKGNVFAVTKEVNQAKNYLFESDASNMRLTLEQLKNFVGFIAKDK